MTRGELNKVFKETQIGNIADTSVTPITPYYTFSDVKALFEDSPDAVALPVESDEGYGLILRDDIMKAHHSIFSDNSIQKSIRKLTHSFKANENVFQISHTILNDPEAHRSDAFLVFYKKNYFGLVSFMDLMAHVNGLKELDERHARDIQEFLLDKSSFNDLPYIIRPYNRMASWLGGDFYRIMKISESLSLVSIFDVSGKGVTGALSTISLSSYFSLFSMNDLSARTPEWIVQSMNRYIYDQTPFGVFITAILMFVDLEKKSVRIFNMGHTEILTFRLKEDRLVKETVDSQLPPLGIDEDLPDLGDYARELELSSDRKIIFYSDGLSEATNDFGAMFGEERIHGFFEKNIGEESDAILDKLRREVESFLGDAPLSDDITVLLTDFSPLDMPLTRSEEQFIENIQFPFQRSFDYSLNLYLSHTGEGGEQMVKHRLVYSAGRNRFLLLRKTGEEGISGYLLAEEGTIPVEGGKAGKPLGLDVPLFGSLLRPCHIRVDWFYGKRPLKEGDAVKDKEMIPLRHLVCSTEDSETGVSSVDLMVSVAHRVPFRMILERGGGSSRLSSRKWVQYKGRIFPKEFSLFDSDRRDERTKVYLNGYKLESHGNEFFEGESLAGADLESLFSGS